MAEDSKNEFTNLQNEFTNAQNDFSSSQNEFTNGSFVSPSAPPMDLNNLNKIQYPDAFNQQKPLYPNTGQPLVDRSKKPQDILQKFEFKLFFQLPTENFVSNEKKF